MKQVEDLTHQIGALQIALNELKEVHATLEEKHGKVLADLELTEKKVRNVTRVTSTRPRFPAD